MLDLVWSAYFGNNGEVIHQFDDVEQTKEHTFKEVQDRNKQSALKMFTLFNKNTGVSYWVDLTGGRVIIEAAISGIKASSFWLRAVDDEVAGNTEHKYRLIYFRRVTHSFTLGQVAEQTSTPTNIDYFLGFQYTTADGKNVKRVIQITKDDDVFMS
jgi:hypothetical protein